MASCGNRTGRGRRRRRGGRVGRDGCRVGMKKNEKKKEEEEKNE
jgi:hypothetical protein